MTDPEDFHVRFARYKAFCKTELGQLYLKHEHALIQYWQGDAAQDEQMMELDKAVNDATHAFVTKLMDLAGV